MGKAKKAKKPKAKKPKKKKKKKKKGTGIFKPVTLSKDLSAICGMTKGTRAAVTKAIWAYIKKKGLSKGRTVSKIPGIFAGGSMFKLPGAVSKHLNTAPRVPFVMPQIALR